MLTVRIKQLAALLSVAPSGERPAAVTDTGIAESLRGLFPDDRTLAEIDEERLAGLVQAEIAGLISAVQQGCAEHNATCQVIVRAGPAIQAVT